MTASVRKPAGNTNIVRTHGRVILDVMPLDARVLGFSNRWYRAALDRADTLRISTGLTIRVVSAPVFIATKLEAFRSRGQADFMTSKDLEDIVSIIDGRPSITSEIGLEPQELRAFLRGEFQKLLKTSNFLNALPALLFPDAASQSRIGLVMERLREIAN